MPLTKKMNFCPAVVLDLDGTVRYSKSGKFINGPQDVALFDDVEPVLWEYRDSGHLILGATNQGGVAYGFKTEEESNEEIMMMKKLFKKDPFHCIMTSHAHPHGTVPEYCYRSLLRKPYYGMLVWHELEANKNGYIIKWDDSIFVGDREEDESCARASGLRFIHADDFFEREPSKDESEL